MTWPAYYDRQGRRLSDSKAAELRLSDPDYKRVAEATIGKTWVSTVWLGLDHQWGDGPPLIFETLVFGGKHDQHMERYSTEEEAIAGHKRTVRMVVPWWIRPFVRQ